MTGPGVPQSALLRRSSIPPQREDFELDDFEAVGKALGRGAFGYVSKVKQKHTGKIFAMKVMSKTKIEEQSLEENIEREISTQQTLGHPNILRLYKYFEDQEDIHLLLEYAPNGSLFDLLRDHRKAAAASGEACQGLPEDRAACMFGDVAGALHFLHCNGVVHRDLKPENILICEDDVVKLADFGWCNQLAAESAGRNTFCGTWEYLSPEMINSEPHDCSVDAWASGVLLFEMLVGRSPFAASSYVQALGRISRVAYEFPDHVSAPARDLVGRLLVKEPGQRLGLGQAAEHPWVRDAAGRRGGGAPRGAEASGREAAEARLGEARAGPGEGARAAAGEAQGGSSPEGAAEEGRSWKTVRRRLLEEPTSASRGSSAEAEPRGGAPPEGAAPEGAAAAGAGGPEAAEGAQRSEARRRLMSATQRRSLKDLRLALAEAERLEIPQDCALMEHAREVLASLSCPEGGGSDSEGSDRFALEAAASVPLIRVISSGQDGPQERAACAGIRSEPAAAISRSGAGGPAARSRTLPGATAHFLDSLQPRKLSPRKVPQLASPRRARVPEDATPPSHALAQLLSPRRPQLLSARRAQPAAAAGLLPLPRCRRALEADGEHPGAATAPAHSLRVPAPGGRGEEAPTPAPRSAARRRSEPGVGLLGCGAAGAAEAPLPAFGFEPAARAECAAAAFGLSPRSEGGRSASSGGGRTPRPSHAAGAGAGGARTPRSSPAAASTGGASTGVGLREHLALRRRQLRVQGVADDLDSTVSSAYAGELSRKDSTASSATCPGRASLELRGRSPKDFSRDSFGAALTGGSALAPVACSLAEEEDPEDARASSAEGVLDCVCAQPSMEAILDCAAPDAAPVLDCAAPDPAAEG